MGTPKGTDASPGKPPIHEVRLGRIKARIWENEHPQNGKWYSVVLYRIFKEGDKLRSAQSFGVDDLLLVAKVCDMAHTWIADQQPDSLGQET